MVAIAYLDNRTQRALSNLSSACWSLTAAGLFLGSALLQLVASLERWGVLMGSSTSADTSIEDHRFDYSYPADPWENLGSTAQFFGLSLLLVALGILAMARVAGNSRVKRMLSLITAASFGVAGLHALVSGLLGVPSPLQFLPVQVSLNLVGVVGLIILAACWLNTSRAASASCLLLLGVTLPGYLLVTFQIAPAIVGYQSHDTTPFTETIVAVSTAAAGVAMLVAAGVTARSRRRKV
ncbi:hypothetical protein [Cryobacterium sp. Y62]|uniref:hypothetical protein n=1 Tax=Cryobacterium sp. Y62 TaxID=2048284 RepID=UPI000CE4C0F0|nr:hypothetical protein [Cryobacterium sp. Y62]